MQNRHVHTAGLFGWIGARAKRGEHARVQRRCVVRHVLTIVISSAGGGDQMYSETLNNHNVFPKYTLISILCSKLYEPNTTLSLLQFF